MTEGLLHTRYGDRYEAMSAGTALRATASPNGSTGLFEGSGSLGQISLRFEYVKHLSDKRS